MQEHGQMANEVVKEPFTCLICEEVAGFNWSDLHGEGMCNKCGMAYMLLKDGKSITPEVIVMEEWIPVFKKEKAQMTIHRLGDSGYMFDEGLLPEEPFVVKIGNFDLNAVWKLLAVRPGARVHLYEADPQVFKKLKEEKLPQRISIINAALTGYCGTTIFYRYEEGEVSSCEALHNLDPTRNLVAKLRVPSISLACLMAGLGVERIDLLMLNCEGGEMYALEALAWNRDLRRRVVQISMCMHGGMPPRTFTLNDQLEMLRRLESHYEIIEHTPRSPLWYLLRQRTCGKQKA